MMDKIINSSTTHIKNAILHFTIAIEDKRANAVYVFGNKSNCEKEWVKTRFCYFWAINYYIKSMMLLFSATLCNRKYKMLQRTANSHSFVQGKSANGKKRVSERVAVINCQEIYCTPVCAWINRLLLFWTAHECKVFMPKIFFEKFAASPI